MYLLGLYLGDGMLTRAPKNVWKLIGVDCRPNNRWNISVARRASVALLDEFIGPKR